MPTTNAVNCTALVKMTYQPHGGYLNIEDFEQTQYADHKILLPDENILPEVLGLVVDYLSRYELTHDVKESFRISLNGVSVIKSHIKNRKSELKKVYDINEDVEKEINYLKNLEESISGVDTLLNDIECKGKKAILAACILVNFDCAYRASVSQFDPERALIPNNNTINNIQVMTERTVNFFKDKQVISIGETVGSPSLNIKADIDILTAKTLWDLKISKYPPSVIDTLQLLVYQALLFDKSKNPIYEIPYCYYDIGIFNPRLNISYHYSMKKLPESIHEIVSNIVFKQVIEIDDNKIIGDEINLVGISFKEGDIYKHCNEEEFLQYVENVLAYEVEPNTVYHIGCTLQISDVIGNHLLGEITKSSNPYWLNKNAKMIGKGMWLIEGKFFYEYDKLIDLLISDGISKEMIFNNLEYFRLSLNLWLKYSTEYVRYHKRVV